MWTLILTTSTKLASISIFKEDILKCNFNINVSKTHSTHLLDEISSILRWLDISIDDISNVIVSIGPGSFTGSRISISLIKGMFVNKKVRVFEVNELDILAYQGFNLFKKKLISAIDANKEKIYYGIYDNEDSYKYMVGKLDEVIELIKKNDYELIGDVCINYKNKLKDNGINISLMDAYLKTNTEVVYNMYLKNRLKETNLIELKPFYLEKSQAEKEKKGE